MQIGYDDVSNNNMAYIRHSQLTDGLRYTVTRPTVEFRTYNRMTQDQTVN